MQKRRRQACCEAPACKCEAIIQKVRTLLICPICMELLKKPYATPCGHTFCHKCITRWLQVHHEVQGEAESAATKFCPVCVSRVRNRELRSPSLISELMEGLVVLEQRRRGGGDEHAQR